MQIGAVAVDPCDEFANTALVVVRLAARGSVRRDALRSLVAERDLHAGVEESQFPQPVLERVEIKRRRLEDGRVGPERDGRAALLRRAGPDLLHGLGDADGELLADVAAVAAHIGDQFGAEAVDAADADAVQAAGDLVAGFVELAAGMKHGQRHFEGWLVVLRVDVNRDAAPVVLDANGAVGLQDDGDLVAEAGQGFVDRVVDDFVDEVVKAAAIGRSDVHRGPFSYGFQALEDLDGRGRIVAAGRASWR